MLCQHVTVHTAGNDTYLEKPITRRHFSFPIQRQRRQNVRGFDALILCTATLPASPYKKNKKTKTKVSCTTLNTRRRPFTNLFIYAAFFLAHGRSTVQQKPRDFCFCFAIKKPYVVSICLKKSTKVLNNQYMPNNFLTRTPHKPPSQPTPPPSALLLLFVQIFLQFLKRRKRFRIS